MRADPARTFTASPDEEPTRQSIVDESVSCLRNDPATWPELQAIGRGSSMRTDLGRPPAPARAAAGATSH